MNIMWNIKHVYRTVRPEVMVLVFLVSYLILMFFINKEKRKQGAKISRVDCVAVLCLAVCITAILGGTLLNRIVGQGFEVMLIPFWSYWETIVLGDWVLGEQIVFNVLIFVPFGTLAPIPFSRVRNFTKMLVIVTIFSVGVEIMQLLFRCGTCEFDDVFSNVLGTIIGYGLWKGSCNIWKTYSSRRKEKNIVC